MPNNVKINNGKTIDQILIEKLPNPSSSWLGKIFQRQPSWSEKDVLKEGTNYPQLEKVAQEILKERSVSCSDEKMLARARILELAASNMSNETDDKVNFLKTAYNLYEETAKKIAHKVERGEIKPLWNQSGLHNINYQSHLENLYYRLSSESPTKETLTWCLSKCPNNANVRLALARETLKTNKNYEEILPEYQKILADLQSCNAPGTQYVKEFVDLINLRIKVINNLNHAEKLFEKLNACIEKADEAQRKDNARWKISQWWNPGPDYLKQTLNTELKKIMPELENAIDNLLGDAEVYENQIDSWAEPQQTIEQQLLKNDSKRPDIACTLEGILRGLTIFPDLDVLGETFHPTKLQSWIDKSNYLMKSLPAPC